MSISREQILSLTDNELWDIYLRSDSLEDTYAAKLELQRRQFAESMYPKGKKQ